MRLVIASRQSDLARIQAYAVGEALKSKNQNIEIEYYFRESLGDKNLNDPLWKMPERGVFTEDFHKGLVSGEWDLVVHSWKDLPVEDRQGTEILATLPREDMRDVLLLKKTSVNKKNLSLFTSSPRRTHNLSQFLKDLLPQQPESLLFEPVRGNVQTRVRKLMEGSQDGLIVAKAALDRLLSASQDEFKPTQIFLRESLQKLNWMVLPLSLNPTAAAQGALAIETKTGREDLKKLFQGIHCQDTFECVNEERKILKGWGGGCHQKIGIAILKRPYGKVIFARGIRDTGEVIDRADLTSSPLKLSGTASFEKNSWFDRQAIHYTSPPDITAHWVSKAEALPVDVQPAHSDLVWTSGLVAWRELAQRGIWVNGSSESLGESEDMRIGVLDGQRRYWCKWTHVDGEALKEGITIRTYKLVPKSHLPKLSSQDQHFYWKSGSSFKVALKQNPWLVEKTHWCGPGHTYNTIKTLLQSFQSHASVHIALGFEEWQKRMQQGN